jgi:nucleoside-diphosphate-sugar epimerase
MKTALVLGAGGFIGSHMVKRLKAEGYVVVGVDLKYPEFSPTLADEFVIGDLRSQHFCNNLFSKLKVNELYQFASDMGGAGYIFTGDNDAHVMHNSAQINLNVVENCVKYKVEKVFYSSSACIYPTFHQENPDSPLCEESSAYPALPDSEYGWEKLFSERLYLTYARIHKLAVRIARYHNIYGPEGAWKGGKEKAPAALSRKVAEAKNGESIEVWGNGSQTRSFLYIDECIEATRRLMESSFSGPVNIGSEEMISINSLAQMVIGISGKNLSIKNIPGPTGVKGRNSDNRLIQKKLGWQPNYPLRKGIEQTYRWIEEQVKKQQ